MKRFLSAIAVALFAVSGAEAASSAPQNAPRPSPDELFLRAHTAVHLGEHAEFARIAPLLKTHDLYAYIEFWQLKIRFGALDQATVDRFIARHKTELIAEKTRSDWVKFLGAQRRWKEFDANYAQVAEPDQETLCYAGLSARSRGVAAMAAEALPLWKQLLDPPDACLPLFDALVIAKQITVDDVWDRIRRQVSAHKMKAARFSMNYLPESQATGEPEARSAIEKPLSWLKRLPARFPDNRKLQELSILAIARLASADVQAAVGFLEKIEGQLTVSQREWAWGQLAVWGAQSHRREAIAWFDKAGTPLSRHLIQWKARAALREQDWPLLRRTIAQMPEELAGQSAWVYWQGRALQAEGRAAEARALFGQIAGKPHFYSHLADEELGRRVTLPPRAASPTDEALSSAAANPGVKRSLALIRVGLRVEGVREWSWAVRGMSDRELLAAAEVARRAGAFDRAIAAAERTANEHDYTLRYLAPFDDQIRPVAQRLALDDAWVYGLTRQESRFVPNAKSSAGAGGLMQLMPKTARWVARKVGIKDYRHGTDVNDTETNVLLGASYMRMVLDASGHPLLASAAYNAGPGRARRWQPKTPVEGAIYAETIPFGETRDYVKKIMSNTMYYALIFGGDSRTIKERLGTIQPPQEEEGGYLP